MKSANTPTEESDEAIGQSSDALLAKQTRTRAKGAIELESRPRQSPYAGSGEDSITTFTDGIFKVSH